MDDLDLRDSLRGVAREILDPRIERQNAAVRSSFDSAGNVKPSALRTSLPPMAFVWYLPGAVSAASNVGAEIVLAGDLRITRIDARSKTATTSQCTVQLTASGTAVERATIQTGQTEGHSGVRSEAGRRTAGEVLRLDVITPGGATDVTVTVTYTVAE